MTYLTRRKLLLVLSALFACPAISYANGAAAAFAANQDQRNAVSAANRAVAASTQVNSTFPKIESPNFGYVAYSLVDAQNVRPYIGRKWGDIPFGARGRLPTRQMAVIGPDDSVPFFEACQMILRNDVAVCDSPDGKPVSLTHLVRQNRARKTAQLLGVSVNLHDKTVLIHYVMP
ncbi:hypothetical protein ACOTHJ_13305 [Achromobacter xylosoxidans]